MNREQMLAVLYGARLALPHLPDRSTAERWSAVVTEIDSHLADGDLEGAKAAAGLAGRRIEIDERFGDRSTGPEERSARPEQAVLVAQVLKHTFRAIADADWEQAARSEECLRRLSPDLGYEISVDGGDFAGRWLVEPAEGRVGVAATRSGKVVVVRAGAGLDEYDDLAAAAKDLPTDVVRQAADRLVREFNRGAWIKQDRHNLPESGASDGR
jgi:hypothetical protein